MQGPRESFGEEISEQGIIFDAKNRADRISIILFRDYANAILPMTPSFLTGRKLDCGNIPPIKSFLEFYGVGGPNSWVLANVGGDLQAEDLKSHPYESLIGEIDRSVKLLNTHLQQSSVEEASLVASEIIQLLESQAPRYSVKHNF